MQRMSVAGLCQICQSNEARHRCENCGNLVCVEHFDRAAGLCIQCADAGGGRRI